MPVKEIQTLLPVFGGNRTSSLLVGELLEDCNWVGVPFAGGMPELWHINASNIVVNDLHCHIINLARAVQHGKDTLVGMLEPLLFHPAELERAQECASRVQRSGYIQRLVTQLDGFDGEIARDYFVTQWMGRSGKASTSSEFTGGVSCRWNGNGGGSNKRFRSAIQMLDQFEEISKRCEFRCMDGLEFIRSITNQKRNGIYVDAPWWAKGKLYEHNVDDTTFHRELRDLLLEKDECTRVVRYGRCEAIDDLYFGWQQHWTSTKKQSGGEQQEVIYHRSSKL